MKKKNILIVALLLSFSLSIFFGAVNADESYYETKEARRVCVADTYIPFYEEISLMEASLMEKR